MEPLRCNARRAQLLDRAGRSHARAWTRDRDCLATEAPLRITRCTLLARRYTVRRGDICGQLIACSLCGAYAQLRNAGLSATCTLPRQNGTAEAHLEIRVSQNRQGRSTLRQLEQSENEGTANAHARDELLASRKPAWMV
eukprot:372304-Amphidinium_carterae.1